MDAYKPQGNVEKARTGTSKARGMALLLSARLWTLFRLNMLFLVCCLPIVTAPASASALSKALMNIVREQDDSLWGTFRTEFKADFCKSLLAGLAMGVLGGAIGLIGYAVMRSGGFAGALGVAWLIVMELLWYFAACYLFPLIALVNLTPAQCLRNALLLAVIELKRNLLLLFPPALMAICALLFPASLPLLLILFAVCQYLVCIVVNPPIQKRVIDPFGKTDRRA